MMTAEEISFLLLLLWAHTVLSIWSPTDNLKTKLISLPLDFIQTQEDLMGVKDVRLGLTTLQAPCWERMDTRNGHMWRLCIMYTLKTYL